LEFGESLEPNVPDDWPNTPMPVYSYRVTVLLLHFLKVTEQLVQLGEVTEPIAVTMHLANINPAYLHRGRRWRVAGEAIVWREDTLTIDCTVNELSDATSVARKVMDRLFQAFGHQSSVHFDDNGDFVKQA